MTILISPETGVPISAEQTELPLTIRIAAAAATAQLLAEHGLDVTPTQLDVETANDWVSRFAEDPVQAGQDLTLPVQAKLTPPAALLINDILGKFGAAVVESSVQIRHLITNKLLIETENDDPKVRLKALELLGKITDVGLFTDRSEVTITHQSTDDLRNKLKEKLQKLACVEGVYHVIPEATTVEHVLQPD